MKIAHSDGTFTELDADQQASMLASFATQPATLDDLRAARIADLTAACQASILGGFVSDALGEPHRYPSLMTDQVNLMGSVTASLLPDLPADWITPFWCADASGEWLMRPHNAVQIQQAGRAGKAHVVVCQTTLDALTADVFTAADATAIAAIVWP